MGVYKDTLEKSRIDEIVEKFKEYGIVLMAEAEEDDAGIYLYIEFTKEIIAFDAENREYVQTESWTIHEDEKFEFYPDELRLFSEF